MWPILQRELREQARQPASYWLRLVAVVTLMVVFWVVWRGHYGQTVRDGRGFFTGLNRLLLLSIWLIGPVLTADCLSREKREGTLGLLFLTPLRAHQVVLGKAFVHTLRAFTVLLATVPLLTIPVLLGGVGWQEALRMLLLHGAALGMALSAGLVASAVSTRWIRTRLLSFLLALTAGGLFLLLHVGALTFSVWLRSNAPATLAEFLRRLGLNLGTVFYRLGMMAQNPTFFWRDAGLGQSGKHGLQQALLLDGLALLLVAAAVALATLALRRTWQATGPAPALQRVSGFFTRLLVSPGWWRRRMQRRLDANPVWWRHTSTWTARVTMWGWLGATLIVLTAAFQGFGTLGLRAMGTIETLLLVGMAFSAAASFRQERESGALELLLVSGLAPERMVWGRLLALGVQFAPSLLVIWGLPLMILLLDWRGWEPQVTHRLPLWLPVTALLGIALALSRWSFLTAFLVTAGVQHVPQFGRLLTLRLTHPESPFLTFLGVVELLLAAWLAWWAWGRATDQLADRTFLEPRGG